jgi:hypothetical protein
MKATVRDIHEPNSCQRKPRDIASLPLRTVVFAYVFHTQADRFLAISGEVHDMDALFVVVLLALYAATHLLIAAIDKLRTTP